MKNLKLAIQKEGRLTKETLEFLWKSGLEFESYKQKLFSLCRNFPLEILYVRDDDIGDYVATGTVDLGILGQNLLFEKRPKVKKLLNLRFGFCSLVLAVPKNSNIKEISDLKGGKIATTYPYSVKNYLKKNNISAKTVQIRGSVEVAPLLGVADAVADLASTGSTLLLNDLKILEKIYESEAVLIVNKKILFDESKKKLLKKLTIRFKAVLSAKNYKYLIMNVPKENLPKLKKLLPGIRSSSVFPLERENWICLQSVIKEEIFWEAIEKLEKLGVANISILPVEKIIV